MKKTILSLCVLVITLSFGLLSCDKEKGNDPGNNNGNTPATTLPVNCDFAGTAIPHTISAMVSGVGYTYISAITGGSNNPVFYPGTIGGPDSVKTCLPSGTDTFGSRGSGSFSGININGVLIADVSNLPAINKVTIKLFQNSNITVKLCDGSNVIATTNTKSSGTAPDVTYTLNVDGKKGSKLYIYSRESIVYSVYIE